MKLRGGLQRNLVLGYLVLVFAVVAGPHALLGELVTARTKERVLVDLERAIRVAQADLEQVPDLGRLQESAERTGAPLDVRLTLVAAGGQVLADSGVERSRVASLGSHLDRPEIALALLGKTDRSHAQRTSETTGKVTLYRALPAVGRARALGVAVIRAAADLSETNAALASVRSAIGWSATGALGLGVVLAFLLSRRITRGVDEVGRLVDAIRLGDALPESTARWGELTAIDRALRLLAGDLASLRPPARREHAHLLAILETSAEPILIVAPDGAIVESSPAARAVFQLVLGEEPRRIGELGCEPIRAGCARVLSAGGEQLVETGLPAHPRARLCPIPGAAAPQGVVIWLERRAAS